jgi:hypothetical protein
MQMIFAMRHAMARRHDAMKAWARCGRMRVDDNAAWNDATKHASDDRARAPSGDDEDRATP